MRALNLLLALVLCTALAGCDDDDSRRGAPTASPTHSATATESPVPTNTVSPVPTSTASPRPSPTPDDALACDSEPVVMTTGAGVDFVRTPDSCFDSLPDWPYEPRYVEIDGLRQAYVEAGPVDGPVVLLLHGQPSWSYLYRKMIPVLADAGFRVIAMDHLGMGRSDKPIDITSYSYLGHCDRLERFIEALDLRDINLFCQDWGSLIGLRVAGLHPDWFARIAVGDGMLPVIPAGFQPYPVVENPDEIADIPSPFAGIPAQQPPFYDGCERLVPGQNFSVWMNYAMKARSFQASEVVEAVTWFDLPADEEAAYDAPFPSRTYMAGARVFPSLVNEVPGTTAEAWAGLTASERPFLTIWASNDPGNLGACETQQQLVDSMPGAAGQPHDRLAEASHFLQDDQGEEIARRLVAFYSDQSSRVDESGRGTRYCEILLGYVNGGEVHAEVWGTQGLNLCPAESWEALDPNSIQDEYGAAFVVMNGPRYAVMDAGDIELPGQYRTYGDLNMQRLATLVVDPASASTDPYTEVNVERTNVFEFWSGFETYELTSPEGAVYVMISMSQIVDPDLTLADLPNLGSRLALPAGWTYQARRRITDLVVKTEGDATVLQDDLQNTYQRVTTSTPSEVLPVLDDGTGTLCTSDAQCQGLEASHCLMATGQQGFCTVEGCAGRGCGAPYVCCHDCNPVAAPFLPFEGSACLPEGRTDQLTNLAGCTCGYGAVSPTATSAPALSSVTPTSTPTPTVEPSPRVGFEILEIQSPNSIRAWISPDITREEFDALDLPQGWMKNQPREGDPDEGRFYRSPGADADGEYLQQELFGFNWFHAATVIETNIPLDDQGLLIGSTVVKFHEVTFNAGHVITVLFSPQGQPYVRIGRDANRVSDEPSIPNSWRLVEYTTPDQLVIQLPEEVLVIRADNQDSFQGPVPELAVAF